MDIEQKRAEIIEILAQSKAASGHYFTTGRGWIDEATHQAFIASVKKYELKALDALGVELVDREALEDTDFYHIHRLLEGK